MFKAIVYSVGAFICLVLVVWAVSFGATGLNLFSYSFWAPRQANAERHVFVNTNSYIQGKTDNLSRLRYEYGKAKDSDEKAGLRTLILSEAANVDEDKLPDDLHAFIDGLK
jgi:hypothetical protein